MEQFEPPEEEKKESEKEKELEEEEEKIQPTQNKGWKEVHPSLKRMGSYEKLKGQIGLMDILSQPLGKKIFREFLIQEFSVENLQFWETLDDLEKFPPSPEVLSHKLQELYQKYIIGPEELNIPYAIRKPVIEAATSNSLTLAVFKESKDFIFSLMSLDSFKRFLDHPQSDYAVQYVLKQKRRSSLQSSLSFIENSTSPVFPNSPITHSSTSLHFFGPRKPIKALDMLGVNLSQEKVKKTLGMSDKDLKKQLEENQLREDERIRSQRKNVDSRSKRQNIKALELLGHDPSEKKLENLLGTHIPSEKQIQKDMKRQAQLQKKEEEKLRKKLAKEEKKKKKKKKKNPFSDEEANVKSDGSFKSDGSTKSEGSFKSDGESMKSDKSIKSGEEVVKSDGESMKSDKSIKSEEEVIKSDGESMKSGKSIKSGEEIIKSDEEGTGSGIDGAIGSGSASLKGQSSDPPNPSLLNQEQQT